MKHCYEQSKNKSEPKQGWKWNDKTKGKWDKKQGRPQDEGNKENAESYKKFNAVDSGHGFQSEERNKGDEMNPLHYCSYGKDNNKKNCP